MLGQYSASSSYAGNGCACVQGFYQACKERTMRSLRLGLTRFSLPERRGRTAPSNRAGTPKLSSEQGTEWVELPSELCLKAEGCDEQHHGQHPDGWQHGGQDHWRGSHQARLRGRWRLAEVRREQSAHLLERKRQAALPLENTELTQLARQSQRRRHSTRGKR